MFSIENETVHMRQAMNYYMLNDEPADVTDVQRYVNKGLSLIREGRVGVVILAGGQGSRLGFEHPKGMYNIGLPSTRSIFQILVDRVMRVQMVAHKSDGQLKPEHQKCKILIMTSAQNHAETLNYFYSRNFFGYEQSNFVFF